MRIKILIAFTIFINSVVIGQNLLRNNSFEEGDYIMHTYDGITMYRPFLSFDKNIEYWKGRFNGVKGDAWHSPDWYIDDSGLRILHNESSQNIASKDVYASNGYRYVGLRDYELIE